MAQIMVDLEDAAGLKATARGMLAAVAIGFVAWNAGSSPADALGVAVAAGYGHLTAFNPATQPKFSRRPKKAQGGQHA